MSSTFKIRYPTRTIEHVVFICVFLTNDNKLGSVGITLSYHFLLFILDTHIYCYLFYNTFTQPISFIV